MFSEETIDLFEGLLPKSKPPTEEAETEVKQVNNVDLPLFAEADQIDLFESNPDNNQ